MTKIFPGFLAPSWKLEMPSEVYLPEEPQSTKEQPWRDLESSQNRRKKIAQMKLKKILNLGSKMRMAPYEAPRIAQIRSLARRKRLFVAIRNGGRVVRFLGLPQAATRLDDQDVGFSPPYSLHFPGSSKCIMMCSKTSQREPPRTQEQPWSDLESYQNKRKNRPKEAQENPEFRFQEGYGAVQGTHNPSDWLAGAKGNIIPGHL
jgi:hypothetical protein